MRLRNIPRAEEVIAASQIVIHRPSQQKGRWREIFGNDHPIHIEVGMGKGRFITELSRKNPQINYVGIERYASVLLRAVEPLEEAQEKPENLRFLCLDAAELPDIFEKGEVERIYLNFSDPWPKDRHAKRRLTSRTFLGRYTRILSENGTVEFKTDNQQLFAFSLEEMPQAGWELLLCTRDLHSSEELMKDNIMTEYEAKFSAQGNPICKLIARPGDKALELALEEEEPEE